jgi:hypothetical protein
MGDGGAIAGGKGDRSMKSEYIPGVCNIGPAEIRSRRLAGWLGLAATVLLWGGMILIRAPAVLRLLLFFPAAGSAVGFLQAAMHFCAAYGILGVWNLGPDVGKTESVEQAQFRREDRLKAARILLYSALIGLAGAAAGYASA